MQYFKQFHQHLKNRNYSSFLGLWDEYCSGDEIEEDELIKILEGTRSSEFGESFGRYVDKALALWKTLGDTPKAHEVFKLIIDIQTSNDLKLGELVLEYIKKHFHDAKDFELKLKLVGLRDLRDFQGAVSNFELLCHLKPGSFVFHSGGWGVGEIMDVSFLREQISLEFDYVAGRKDLSFQNAFRNLIPLSNDHFLAKRFGNPDELEDFAKEKPVEVLKMLLKDLGPKTASEIKDELCELVIPENEWTKWWQSTRSKAKKDTSIEIPTEIKEPFALRHRDIAHEERLQKALEKKPTVQELIQMVYSFLRDFPATLKNQEFKANLQEKLQIALSSKENLNRSQELQLLFFLEDLEAGHGSEAISKMIKESEDLNHLVSDIEIVAFKKRALLAIRSKRDDWAVLFFDMLFKVNMNTLRDYILQELVKDKKERELKESLNELLAHPARYPNALIWYFKKIMTKNKLPYGDNEGKNKFFEAFLILLSTLEKSGPEFRDLVKKMISFITNGRYANVRKIFQEADIEQVQEFVLLATKCASLTSHDIKIFHSLAEVVHPSLSNLRKSEEDEEFQEHVIWTTEEGLQKVKSRIEKIGTVETVENAKEIEAARALGDLRENSEFKFALEKRDRLQNELKLLSDQVNQARIIMKDDVPVNKVGIGSIINCVDEHGKEVTYTLLGPWDADTDKNILSFQSKLAQNLRGLQVGETFKIQNMTYTIKDLKSYLEIMSAEKQR